MKKLIAIISTILLLVCACSHRDTQDSNQKIWLFTIGQSDQDVTNILKDNRYNYQQTSEKSYTLYMGTEVVDYLGIEWPIYGLAVGDNALKCILFSNLSILDSQYKITDSELDSIVKSLDSIYGEHRKDVGKRSDEENQIVWKWEKNNITVELTTMFQNEAVTLVFSEKGFDYKNSQ